jgi:hypothetical protein
MKKLLMIAGAVAALGMLTAYAGGIVNPESLNARGAVLNAGKATASADCPCPCAQCGKAPCCCGKACPKLASCPKGGECPKAWCAKGECPKAACPKGPCAASQACPKAAKAKADQ